MHNLRGRLGRLERTCFPRAGRCPACPPIALVTEDAHGNLVEGAYPEPCSRCGGPYDGSVRVIIVRLPPDETSESTSDGQHD
jgi:hypothetical protein